jgi:hypothetical protein
MFDSAQKAQYMDGHREKFMRLVHLFDDTSVMFSQLFKSLWSVDNSFLQPYLPVTLHLVSSLLFVV